MVKCHTFASFRDTVKENGRRNVLELYSGIGGYSAVLDSLGISVNTVAVEINDAANCVYEHNHSRKDLIYYLHQKDIKALDVSLFNSVRFDWLFMSPPCQPYSRQGKRLQEQDSRNDSFEHVLCLLEAAHDTNLPELIVLENVPEFKDSASYTRFITILEDRFYSVEAFIISSLTVGIPNNRRRLYVIASRSRKLERPIYGPGINLCSSVKDLLDVRADVEVLELSKMVLKKGYAVSCDIFDLCAPQRDYTACFTKAYGRYVNGTGSVLRDSSLPESHETGFGRLRLFSPSEVLRLMGYNTTGYKHECSSICNCSEFSFPERLTLRQRYALIGNSLNPIVIRRLLVDTKAIGEPSKYEI